MSSNPSVSLFPEQVAALNGLVREVEAFAVDLAPDTHRSLRVVTFTARPGEDDEDTTPVVRCWSVSVAGTVREHSELSKVAA